MDEPVLLEPSWPDLVFHVLAHVPVPSSVPASLFDAGYVAFAAEHLGPASERALGQDSGVLARLLPDHGRLAGIQGLAFLFEELATARACGERGLDALTRADGCDVTMLASLARAEVGAELLWAAALLELDAYCALPPAAYTALPFQRALDRLLLAAPHLAACQIRHARALGRAGRVVRDQIWLGLPVDPEIAAFQAAHEATVAEVSALDRRLCAAGDLDAPLGEREVEGVAVVLLGARCRASALESAHARFCGDLRISSAHCSIDSLSAAQRLRYTLLHPSD